MCHCNTIVLQDELRLIRRTGHTRLVKVKSDMGMPMNAAADAQADIGAEGDPTTCETMEAATMPILFRAQARPPALHFSQFSLAHMAQSRAEQIPNLHHYPGRVYVVK